MSQAKLTEPTQTEFQAMLTHFGPQYLLMAGSL
jgi:hypothetical protein